MAETSRDGHENVTLKETNDIPPLVPIMAKRNSTIRWCPGPSRVDCPHGVGVVSSINTEEDKENGRNVAVNSQRSVIGSFNMLVTILGSSENKLDASSKADSTPNFNILATAAKFADRAQEMPPHFQNLPLAVVNIGNQSIVSPLAELSGNRSSVAESVSVSATMSTSNDPYQSTTYGAYLSFPASVGLRNITCLNEDAHDLGYDSNGEVSPFLIL